MAHIIQRTLPSISQKAEALWIAKDKVRYKRWVEHMERLEHNRWHEAMQKK
ncbi:hypothetical protein HKBW3S25_00312 [Candidatus Hakubella thermalkaliphila]|uniref:Uncharacterized protein n=1 Tax=Candidatus Hakubella thermalkaliphila TaxID=2754717 RepID=A0A6V8NZN8_9ACTN|nr:hypothetical protein HKBW3S25_00312 [Candidatus Hakubella thermalkaliphila]